MMKVKVPFLFKSKREIKDIPTVQIEERKRCKIEYSNRGEKEGRKYIDKEKDKERIRESGRKLQIKFLLNFQINAQVNKREARFAINLK